MPAPKELDPSISLPALYGVKLRKLRVRAGFTQRQLGDKIPIAHSRIAQFELGKETPPEDVNAKLDAVLGADGDLIDLWGHIKRTPIPDWARKFMEYEARASAMHQTAIGAGYKAAPQVFWFAPHQRWYLIHQTGDNAAYSTTTDIANPRSWTAPKKRLQDQGLEHLSAAQRGDRQ